MHPVIERTTTDLILRHKRFEGLSATALGALAEGINRLVPMQRREMLQDIKRQEPRPARKPRGQHCAVCGNRHISVSRSLGSTEWLCDKCRTTRGRPDIVTVKPKVIAPPTRDPMAEAANRLLTREGAATKRHHGGTIHLVIESTDSVRVWERKAFQTEVSDQNGALMLRCEAFRRYGYDWKAI